MPETSRTGQVDPPLAMKLDAFTVPGLPPGFAERLVAMAEAEASAAPDLPRLRRPRARRWLRGGVSGLGALAIGMISISAAAMGYLGEPIRHAVSEAPVIGTVVERVIPKAMRERNKPAPVKLARPATVPVQTVPIAPATEEAQPAGRLTPMERRARIREIMADPEKRRAWAEAHPEAARRMIRRAEIRKSRIEAGLPVRPLPVDSPRLQGSMDRPLRAMPGPERRERLEYLRQLRRERMEMRRQRLERLEGEAVPPEVQAPDTRP